MLSENGKASLGRWSAVIVFIMICAYCLVPFVYTAFGKQAPIAPDILLYMFLVSMGYVSSSKWAEVIKSKVEGKFATPENKSPNEVPK
jgi:uncharacterized membrane protein